jgi:hypothetical protein
MALHAIGSGFSGLFGDLPAIFARTIAQEGLQIEESVLVDFGTGKMGGETLMQGV